jgi:hypothetical protein
VVRSSDVSACVDERMLVRDPGSLELPADIAASRAGQEHDQPWDRFVDPSKRGDEDIRTLDQLRLEALAPADTVLLERADDERVPGEPEARPCRGTALTRRDGKVLEVDSDRYEVDRARLDAGLQDEVAHLVVGHLDPRDAVRIRAESVERSVELRVARSSGPTVQVGGAESMARLEPPELERLEVAREEDGLPFGERSPARGADLIAGALGHRFELPRVLVDGPSGPLSDGEEPRVLRPRTRSHSHESPRDRASSRPRGLRKRHRSTSR